MPSDFNWNDADTIVLREQAAIAIYRNPEGDLVIRQQGWEQSEDSVIIVVKNNEQEFIDRLTDFLGIGSAP